WISEENQELLKKEGDNKKDTFLHPQFGIND
ncbi:DUF3905 domain-containing protein, partial [Bacillus cereus group sp. Bce025]